MITDAPVRRHAELKMSFRETFTIESLAAGYAKSIRPPAVEGMPEELAKLLLAAYEEHKSELYVVTSYGVPIAWGCVRCQRDDGLTVPSHTYPHQITRRHQAIARRA